MTPRELRLRARIDQLTDERDAALQELAETREDIRVARSVAAKGHAADDGTHAWLAEYDRRKAARQARKRQRRVAA